MGFQADAQSGGFVADTLPPKPATAADRLQALEGGALQGGAYLATLPFDTAANTYNLLKTGRNYAVSKLSGGRPAYEGMDPDVRAALEAEGVDLSEPSGPSPVGAGLTRLMDKSPVTTTQPIRPDDTASRYLHAAGAAGIGAAAGGAGSLPATARGLVGAIPSALAAQGVHEAHPFENEALEGAAELGAGTLGGFAGSRAIPGRAVQTPQNIAVEAGQQAGYKFPAATTNPSALVKGLTKMAGGAEVQDRAQAHNQPITTAGVREDLQLPGQGHIRPDEIVGLRRTENANYRAIEQAGPVTRDQPMVSAIQQARARYSGAGQMSPTLAHSDAPQVLDELVAPGVGTQFDAAHGVATVSRLRDRASAAFAQGNSADAQAYRAAATAVEDAMGRSLAGNQQTAGLASAWAASRRRLAQAHTAEDAMDANGNVDATKLGRMLADGEPLTGNMATAARAANAAPKAFRVPESGTAGGHGGFWGPLIGASVGGEGLSHIAQAMGLGSGAEAAGGFAPLAAYGLYKGAKAVSKPLALANALSLRRENAPINASTVTGAATGMAGVH